MRLKKAINWWIGDLAKFGEQWYPSTWSQSFPVGSHDDIHRCKGVADAYPAEADRNTLASWTVHMHAAGKTDRIARVASSVKRGLTSDESRISNSQAIVQEEPQEEPRGHRWLLAIDTNYYLTQSYYGGGGLQSARNIINWVQNVVSHLKPRGLTDVVCCFDSIKNDRKSLTAGWEEPYKKRKAKEHELIEQIHVCQVMLETPTGGRCIACAQVHGKEADDCLASYAAQFPKYHEDEDTDVFVTLLTGDKDLRQCLVPLKVNILLDAKFVDAAGGERQLNKDLFVTAEAHKDETLVDPTAWAEYQTITGDKVDNIRGAKGIGPSGARELLELFDSAESAITAAKAGDTRITTARRQSLIDLSPRVDVTLQLVTMLTDLELPMDTKI